MSAMINSVLTNQFFLMFLAIASMANNCKTGECQKNSRQSDSFIVLKKLCNANGGKGAT